MTISSRAFFILGLSVAALPLRAASLTPSQEAAITAAVESEIASQGLPGAMVAIQRGNDAPFLLVRGTANYRSGQPLRREMHFRIGSITKSFVTSVVLLLAQQRKLSLEDPISKYVAGVPNGGRITLHQLANMTSGLQGYTLNPDFLLPFFTNQPLSKEQLVQLGLKLPPIFAPGEKWSYSNTNTVLLGRVVEIVTGQPLELVLRQRIWRPLGMRETSLPRLRSLPRPFSHGYTTQTINGQMAEATRFTPTLTWAAGGGVSTIDDLLRAAPFLATGRPLLSPATQRQRLKWTTVPPLYPRQKYGFGISNFNGWIGHNGGLPGYTTVAWHLPSRKLTLVVSVNSDIHVGPKNAYEPAPWIASKITRILTPGHTTPPLARGGYTGSGSH